MGVCLFGNELLSKNLQSSFDGLNHLGDGLRRAVIQVGLGLEIGKNIQFYNRLKN
jgi:hypothetical protein